MQQIPQQREPSTEITYRSLRDPRTDNSGESPGSSLRIRTLCRAYRVATGGGTLSDVKKDTLGAGSSNSILELATLSRCPRFAEDVLHRPSPLKYRRSVMCILFSSLVYLPVIIHNANNAKIHQPP